MNGWDILGWEKKPLVIGLSDIHWLRKLHWLRAPWHPGSFPQTPPALLPASPPQGISGEAVLSMTSVA